MTATRDDLDDDIPTARCRGKCGEDYPTEELTDGLCPDCYIEKHKRGNKRKGYRNDIHSDKVDNETMS